MKKKQIAFIPLILITIFLLFDVLTGGNFVITHYHLITTTFDLMGKEQEYVDYVSETEQAKWFANTFSTEPKYSLGYGFRQVNYQYVAENGSAALSFLDSPPNFTSTSYYCRNGDILVILDDLTSSTLDEFGNCFQPGAKSYSPADMGKTNVKTGSFELFP